MPMPRTIARLLVSLWVAIQATSILMFGAYCVVLVIQGFQRLTRTEGFLFLVSGALTVVTVRQYWRPRDR